jgi:hypothetical protein
MSNYAVDVARHVFFHRYPEYRETKHGEKKTFKVWHAEEVCRICPVWRPHAYFVDGGTYNNKDWSSRLTDMLLTLRGKYGPRGLMFAEPWTNLCKELPSILEVSQVWNTVNLTYCGLVKYDGRTVLRPDTATVDSALVEAVSPMVSVTPGEMMRLRAVFGRATCDEIYACGYNPKARHHNDEETSLGLLTVKQKPPVRVQDTTVGSVVIGDEVEKKTNGKTTFDDVIFHEMDGLKGHMRCAVEDVASDVERILARLDQIESLVRNRQEALG